MIQKFTLLILTVFLTVSYGFSQGGLGTVRGTVTDAETKEPIPFCKVTLKKGSQLFKVVCAPWSSTYPANYWSAMDKLPLRPPININ